jgi:hypothetical protein
MQFTDPSPRTARLRLPNRARQRNDRAGRIPPGRAHRVRSQPSFAVIGGLALYDPWTAPIAEARAAAE